MYNNRIYLETHNDTGKYEQKIRQKNIVFYSKKTDNAMNTKMNNLQCDKR